MSQFQQGPRHRFRNQVFWAEGGMVCIERQDTGDFRCLTRAEAAARAIALNGELAYVEYPDEREELSRCVVALAEAVKEAKRQGDPTDPAVRRERLKSMRKVSMLTGGSTGGGVLLKPSEEIAVAGPLSKRFRNISI